MDLDHLVPLKWTTGKAICPLRVHQHPLNGVSQMAPNGTSRSQLTPYGVGPLRRTTTNFDLFDQNCELCVSRFGVKMGYPRTLRDDLLTEVGLGDSVAWDGAAR